MNMFIGEELGSCIQQEKHKQHIVLKGNVDILEGNGRRHVDMNFLIDRDMTPNRPNSKNIVRNVLMYL